MSRQMKFESLEDRKLMAASIDYNGGALEIQGTNNDDLIIAEETTQTGYSPYWYNRATGESGGGYYTYDAITVTVRNRNTGELQAQSSINSDYVDRIVIEALDGRDMVLNNTSVRSEIFGGAGGDDITGGSGNDTLHGGDGDDMLRGITGNDRMYGDNGADWLIGGYGNDTLVGGDGNDDLDGGSGNDYLDGRGGGNYDKDFLLGRSGRDTLIGGGQDLLWGGEDQDVYYYQAWDIINDSSVAGYGWQIFPDNTYSSGIWAGYSRVDEVNAPLVRSGF